jgi:hypothetical protein
MNEHKRLLIHFECSPADSETFLLIKESLPKIPEATAAALNRLFESEDDLYWHGKFLESLHQNFAGNFQESFAKTCVYWTVEPERAEDIDYLPRDFLNLHR